MKNILVTGGAGYIGAFACRALAEKGFLPYPGGYLDQPNRIVEICNYMDYLLAEKLKREITR